MEQGENMVMKVFILSHYEFMTKKLYRSKKKKDKFPKSGIGFNVSLKLKQRKINVSTKACDLDRSSANFKL